MKKFSEDHGGVAIILIVIAVLLLIVGSVKGLDEVTGKVNGFGVASIVGNAYAKAINKFDESFDNTLNGVVITFFLFNLLNVLKIRKKMTCLFSCFQNF